MGGGGGGGGGGWYCPKVTVTKGQLQGHKVYETTKFMFARASRFVLGLGVRVRTKGFGRGFVSQGVWVFRDSRFQLARSRLKFAAVARELIQYTTSTPECLNLQCRWLQFWECYDFEAPRPRRCTIQTERGPALKGLGFRCVVR